MTLLRLLILPQLMLVMPAALSVGIVVLKVEIKLALSLSFPLREASTISIVTTSARAGGGRTNLSSPTTAISYWATGLSLKNQNKVSDGKFMAEQLNVARGQVVPEEDVMVSADKIFRAKKKHCTILAYQYTMCQNYV